MFNDLRTRISNELYKPNNPFIKLLYRSLLQYVYCVI